MVAVIIIAKFFAPSESYRPATKEVVKALVDDVTPKLKSVDFTMQDVQDLLGNKHQIDAEEYYQYKTLRNNGTLTKENLMKKFVMPYFV